MKDRVEYLFLISLSIVVRILGLKLSRQLSFILTSFFFYIVPIRKKTVLDNLRKSFPDFSEKKINQIAYGTYKSFVITLIELLYFPSLSQKEITSFVSCPLKDTILKRYNENKGLILVSAHFGNWEYMALSVSLQIKVPFTIPTKKQSNVLVNDWLDSMRTKFGNKIVPLGISIRNIYSELKNRNIIALLADQRGPAEGIRVNFMGRDASVYSGPAVLSLKTEAPLVFGIAVRQKDYSYIVHIEEVNMTDLPEDKEEKVKILSQRYTDILEKYIRIYPEQWFWMHKRWKY